ncbi:MAG: T9SS type A sorting domain-containing protein [Bacteroidota bacterium]
MKKELLLVLKSLSLAVSILILTSNITFAQTTIIVESGLNTILDAVTDHPGDTLILKKGENYVLDQYVFVTEPTVIKGEDYTLEDTDPPALISMVADPGTAGGLWMFLPSADFTLENVAFIGYTPSNEAIGGPVAVDGEGITVNIVNCVGENLNYLVHGGKANRNTYNYHDNIFFNLCTERADNYSGSLGPANAGDSLIYHCYNNTFFTGGRAQGLTTKGAWQQSVIDHNTYVNTWGETYYKNYGYQYTLTNNIYYNSHIRGYVGERLKADTVYYEGDHISYDDFGDTLNGEVISFPHVIDSVDMDGLERIFVATNNLKFNEQRVLDWNDAHTVTEQPFLTPSNAYWADRYGWTIENNWTPDDGTDYDPEFSMAIPDDAFEILWLQSEERRLAAAERSLDYPHALIWSPNDEAKGEFIWPLPFEFKPTTEALMTAGSDGYPLGDLNWFGPEMVAAWENGHAYSVGEIELTDLDLVNYPNPFSSTTRIRYNLPSSSDVIMKIYDVTGAEVANLVNEAQIAGQHEVMFDGANLSGGVYFCRIMAGNAFQVHKMTLIK